MGVFRRALALLLTLTQGQVTTAQLESGDAPSSANFVRRAFASAIVVGDHVYIDGGEVSYRVNGRLPSRPYEINSTLSLPLSISWTNSTVPSLWSLTPRPRAVPVFNNQAAFRSPSDDAFYIWGGVVPHEGYPPPSEIWRFTVDDNRGGTGSWDQIKPDGDANNDLAKALRQNVRTTHAAWTQSADMGYWIGGYANQNTDQSVVSSNRYLALPGVVGFNMTSSSSGVAHEIKNGSTVGMGRYGTVISGSAQFVPSYGGGGVIIMLGGAEAPVLTGYKGWIGTTYSFGNLSVWDAESEKWYHQQATGEVPSGREAFCVAGVQGGNGSYEIFLYGGYEYQNFAATDEVYVLSLPGFVFFKAKGLPEGTPRMDHACAVVGKGKRQLLSVGGTYATSSVPNFLLDPDPWTNGLGIFDMSAMKWSDGYDAEADEYESPDVVKQWYERGGLDSVQWSSPEVKGLFLGQSDGTSPSSGPKSGGGGGSSDDSNGTESSPSGGSGVSKKAIIGGVVGGVIFGILVGVLAAWLLVRRRAARNDSDSPSGEYAVAEKIIYAGSMPKEMPAGGECVAAQELPAASQERPELMSEHGKAELYGCEPEPRADTKSAGVMA